MTGQLQIRTPMVEEQWQPTFGDPDAQKAAIALRDRGLVGPVFRGGTVCIVGCGRQKLPHEAPARELYTSTLFRLSAQYAETAFDRWYILSALHGIVDPDEVLKPYDFTLDGNFTKHEIANKMGGLAHQLQTKHLECGFTLLAGGHYRQIARLINADEPLAGLGIGQRLAWLKQACADSGR